MGIPVRVLGTFDRLDVRLERVAQVVQAPGHGARRHRMPQSRQLLGQGAGRLARPLQQAHRIAGCGLLQDTREMPPDTGIDSLDLAPPPSGAANPADRGGEQRRPPLQLGRPPDNRGARHPRQLRETADTAPPQRQGFLGHEQTGLVLVQGPQHSKPAFVGVGDSPARHHVRIVSHVPQRTGQPQQCRHYLCASP